MPKYPYGFADDIANSIMQYPSDVFTPVLRITLNGQILSGWVFGVDVTRDGYRSAKQWDFHVAKISL